MKTPEQILIEVANEHSYNDWGELMYDTHESSQIEYTKEAMEIYANQQNTALQTELAQVRKERDSANKLLEMAWASVNSSAKVCKNPTDIRLAKMIEAHLTPAAPDNLK